MEPIVLAFTNRAFDGPLTASVAAFSFVTSLVFTAAVGWLASRVGRERQQRQLEELAAATPAAGVH
jgi:hypothetical protein